MGSTRLTGSLHRKLSCCYWLQVFITCVTILIMNFVRECSSIKEIKLAVLVPKQESYLFNIRKIEPAIEYAIQSINNSYLILQDVKWTVNYRNSECSEVTAPLKAIDLFVEKNVSVFLGPVCDYAVAPVARYSPYWNIPIISPGANVIRFGNKTEYKLLTRIQGSYAKTAWFVDAVARAYNWSRIGMLFHNNMAENDDLGKSDCFFALEPVYNFFRHYYHTPWYKTFDENSRVENDFKARLVEASKETRSKYSVGA